MRVKRFVGDNVAETMGKIKRDLGSEAVILQTRQYREGGFFGFFGKPKVEIMAAIEDHPAGKKAPMGNSDVPNPAGNPRLGYRQDSSLGMQGGTQSLGAAQLLGGAQNPRVDVNSGSAAYPGGVLAYAAGSLAEPGGIDAPETAPVQQELKQMRQMLEQMNKQMEGLGEEKTIWPTSLRTWADFLRQRGLSESLVRRLLRQVQQSLREEEWASSELVYATLKESVLKMCAATGAIRPGTGRPTVVALIGPTGVGKTTTIGKLAAGFSIVDKRKVALITADTYRVAAVEQLKTFGEIIGVDVEVAMTPSGLREALLKHTDKELVFIDTAGRSPHHEMHMSELRAFLDKAKPNFTLLVMSATTQLADQLRVFQRFRDFASHVIFTKLDETECSGSLLNVLQQTTLPVAYVTNGQNVPDDIEIATPERLTYYILGEEKPHV